MMLDRICMHEQKVVEALAAGRSLDAALEAHGAACKSCREAADVVRALQGAAAEPLPAHQLPDPDVIWWKAQLLRRWEVERKVAAPIERMHRAEIIAGIVAFAGFLAWQWSGLARVFSTALPSLVVNWSAHAATAPQAAGTGNLGLILGSLFVGVMILAGVHRMLAE